jgi:hypothetical protein
LKIEKGIAFKKANPLINNLNERYPSATATGHMASTRINITAAWVDIVATAGTGRRLIFTALG